MKRLELRAIAFFSTALMSAACGSDSASGSRGSGGASDGGGTGGSKSDASADSPDDGNAGSGGTSGSDAGSDASANQSCPVLLKYGLDIPSPGFVADHAATIDAMPFDGLIVNLASSSAIQRSQPVNASELESELAPMKTLSLKNVRHNFVRVLATNAGSFDDYAGAAANFRALAAAAKNAGLDGIFFDNEEYFPELGSVWGPTACTAPDLATCQASARAAGKLVMSEMIAEWADVVVLVTYGPWVSEPKTSQYFAGHFPYNDVSAANPFMGPFVVGMIEASAGTNARFVDGGELYAIRDQDDFAYAHQWMKWELPKQSSLIPASLSAAYGDAVSIAFGVYDQSFRGSSMSSATWQSTLQNALGVSDRYVWAYTELYDWWGVGWPQGGPPPQAWIDASAAARQAASTGCTRR